MKFHVGADHAGFGLKQHLVTYLQKLGHEVVDHGTQTPERVDYPDYAGRVAKALQADGTEDPSAVRGLLVCGSGIGVSITANRFHGVRAVLVSMETQAYLARAHNNANVLCMGERLTGELLAERIVDVFIETPFEAGRHAGRVSRIEEVSTP